MHKCGCSVAWYHLSLPRTLFFALAKKSLHGKETSIRGIGISPTGKVRFGKSLELGFKSRHPHIL